MARFTSRVQHKSRSARKRTPVALYDPAAEAARSQLATNKKKGKSKGGRAAARRPTPSSVPSSPSGPSACAMARFEARRGVPLPDEPPLLASLDERCRGILDELDIDVVDRWGSALDEGDDFGFDLTGDFEVLRFASQATGSIFGLWVGGDDANLDADALQTRVPVVHVDSEGSASRVAGDLSEFVALVIALNSHLADAVGRVGSSAIGEADPATEADVEEIKATFKEHLANWRESSGPCGSVPAADLAYLGAHFGLDVDPAAEEAAAVDRLFAADYSTEVKFRPKSQDE